VLSLRTVAAGLAVGTLITPVAAIVPARRASRILPVAALQDVAAEPRRLSALRMARGAILTAGGAAVLCWGLFASPGSRVLWVGLGLAAVFMGVSVLGPLVARPVSRVLGAPLAVRTTGRLAQQNAMRNPSRTAATAAALMVGVTLVSVMTIIAASMKTSANSVISSAMLNLVYGLLALAVIIALIGIANTLVLSVYERTRELGLLRAVGTTRGQLRSMVRLESLVISLVGAIEGLTLGMLFGWAIVAAMHSQGVTHLVFPVAELVALAVLAGLAGIVAAISPSRRAARLDILKAVTTE
jgi:putative ABC transport system permease protein